MSEPTWILTKLGGKTGQAIICSSSHPDYSPEKWDIAIGQDCFARNWDSGRLVNVADHLHLTAGHFVFAFRQDLEAQGIKI